MKIYVEQYNKFIIPLTDQALKLLTEAQVVSRKYNDGYKYFINPDKTVAFDIIHDKDVVVVDPVQKKLDKLTELEKNYSEMSSEKWKLEEEVKALKIKLQGYVELHGSKE